MNNVVLVGRLAKIGETKYIGDKKYLTVNIAIPRTYKNLNGEYETDFITVKLSNLMTEKVLEFCKKGDVIGVRGRLESETIMDELTGENKYITIVNAEKLTFLQAQQNRESVYDYE